MRTVAALALVGGNLFLPANADIGGYTMVAEAAPIALHIVEPTIPIPAEPQLELNLSYSRAKASTGTGRAVSSLLWPGDAVGYGLPELLGNPDFAYPVKVDAAHPSGPPDGKQEVLPGTGSTSHADDKTIEASSSLAKHTPPALPGLPGLTPGMPVPASLIALEAVASHSKTVVEAGKVTSSAYATAGTLKLLGGLVTIGGVRAEAQATSNGTTSTSSGKVAWQTLTIAGQKLPESRTPAIPEDIAKRMAGYGLSITLPKVDTKDGRTAGRGLTVTLDTAVLRQKFALSWLLDPLLALLPADARNQLAPWLNLAPKLIFILGTATAEAVATQAYVPDSVPPVTDTSTGSSGSGAGSGTGAVPPADAAPPGTEPQPAASASMPSFPGVPGWMVLVGVLVAAGMSYGLRHLSSVVAGGTGCDLGSAGGVPDLRKG